MRPVCKRREGILKVVYKFYCERQRYHLLDLIIMIAYMTFSSPSFAQLNIIIVCMIFNICRLYDCDYIRIGGPEEEQFEFIERSLLQLLYARPLTTRPHASVFYCSSFFVLPLCNVQF